MIQCVWRDVKTHSTPASPGSTPRSTALRSKVPLSPHISAIRSVPHQVLIACIYVGELLSLRMSLATAADLTSPFTTRTLSVASDVKHHVIHVMTSIITDLRLNQGCSQYSASPIRSRISSSFVSSSSDRELIIKK